MYIKVKCDMCEVASDVSYDQLYPIWKEGYDRTPEDRKEAVFLTAEVKCTCGHTQKFNSPMFQHTFGVIFNELLSLEDH
jgi:hypothetical protein